ncbi:fungal pheromone STE3G-protein-coupled receptor [Auriscalpium vulgare]|uniref:Fungal pheromone STE3G-protein-coupled receptor n=1 Tax=Auriscalpium vulgare TaxID=40419 RepID=A0ACB8R8T0_9AGAM|nr:fungal pheromone STE3G-protein-coupled receptor [Auriscalpium vulgare]
MFVSLPIGAFIAAFCVLVPTPWHWRARSVPTLSMIAWLFIGNLTFAINAVIWVDSVRIVVPVWCDIVTKLQMGATVGLPAACLCLAIRLESIASVRNATVTHQMKVRRIIFDLCMCWGLPMLYMTLHTVVQGHRFDIVENFGCRPTIYVSVVAIFLVFIPPLVLSVGTLGFAGMALVHFFRRRVTFAKHLAQTDSAMTSARYFRLMLMAIVEMVFTTVISSLNVWFTSRDGLRPWLGWDGVHSGFKQIGQFPFAFIPTSDRQWTFVLWWSVPVTSYVFFIFFAFGEDAMKEYRKVLPWFRHRILRRRPSDANSPYSGYVR